jgi:hypothetical protein
VASQTVRMPRKKADPPTPAATDREQYRKRFKPARIRWVLAELAVESAAEAAQDFTQWVNDAVRMRLQQEGKWPPKKPAR